jgi:hypothetical protein
MMMTMTPCVFVESQDDDMSLHASRVEESACQRVEERACQRVEERA